MKEQDLYQPIKHYLESLGYTVRAEVRNLDIMASKSDTVIVIEMKTSITLKLLYQGCDRQRMFDNVYLAIPHPGYKVVRTKSFQEKKHILHRLRLGLLLVDIKKNKVDVVMDPKEYVRKTNKRKQKLLLDEFNTRSTSINIGGVNRKKIMTAYKEQAIEIAGILMDGPKTTREIRAITKIKKTTNILYDNYYQWFERISHGIYGLTAKGMEEIANLRNHQ